MQRQSRLLYRASSSQSPQPPRSSSSSSGQETLEGRRRAILTGALRRVHYEGWTDDAVAGATLDAGLPPSYIGQATSSSLPSFGNGDLVAFFMDECNSSLRERLQSERSSGEGQQGGGFVGGVGAEGGVVASRINDALQTRLAMVLPYVASGRWQEGMAIGALPQNAMRTAA